MSKSPSLKKMYQILIKTSIRMIILLIFINIAHAENGYMIVPINYCSNLGLIDVNVNGYKVPLIVDLGTTTVNAALSQNILNKCSAKFVSNMHGYFTNYKNERFPFKKYIIYNFSVGNYQIKNACVMTFPCFSFFTEKSNPKVSRLDNGTIGIESFKNFRVIFDYPHKKIILIKTKIPHEYNVSHWKKFHFHYDKSGAILIDAIVHHVPLTLLLDSGASLSVINPSNAKVIAFPQQCPKEVVIGPHCKMVTADNMDLNEYHLKSQIFYLLPSKNHVADATLGADFFKKHIFFIEFNKKFVAIE